MSSRARPGENDFGMTPEEVQQEISREYDKNREESTLQKLNRLEKENACLRAENAKMLKQLNSSSAADLKAPAVTDDGSGSCVFPSNKASGRRIEQIRGDRSDGAASALFKVLGR